MCGFDVAHITVAEFSSVVALVWEAILEVDWVYSKTVSRRAWKTNRRIMTDG